MARRSPKPARSYFPDPDEPAPLFPPNTLFSPHSPCPHGHMPTYTRLVCMCCHVTGGALDSRLDSQLWAEKFRREAEEEEKRARFQAELQARRAAKMKRKHKVAV